MGALAALRQAGREWQAAWRTRQDDPLFAAWTTEAARRRARLPWLRRGPGLASLGIALALAAGGFELFLLYELLRLPEVSPRHAQAYISGAAAVLLFAGLAFAICWYGARLFGVLQAAFGLLSSVPRRRFDLAVDDLVALTALGDAEVLLGCVRFTWARVMPPVLVLSAAVELNLARLGLVARSDGAALHPVGGLLFAMLAISGGLLSPALVLLAIGLSRGRQASFLPSIGAGVIVFLQPVLGLFSAALLAMDYEEKPLPHWEVPLYNLVALLVLAGLLWLSDRSSPLRAALAGALPLVWLLPHYFLASCAGALAGRCIVGSPLPLLAAGLLTPLDWRLWLLPLVDDGSFGLPETYAAWLYGLPYELLFLLMAGLFASRALHLRRRGVE